MKSIRWATMRFVIPITGFEWTRAELEQYCTQWIQDRPYTFTLSGIGEKHEQYGQPTQMVVFHRIGGQHL